MLIFKMKVRKVMGLLSKKVEVVLCNNIKYYESLGYNIPKKLNKNNQLVNDIGSKILVEIEDLPPYSNVNVNVKCDNCGKEYEKFFIIIKKLGKDTEIKFIALTVFKK